MTTTTPSPPNDIDPRTYATELDQVLATLIRAKRQGTNWISSVELSRNLRDEYSLSIHWRRMDSLLADARGKVQRRKRQNRWEYLILADGEASLQTSAPSITFVDPANALQSVVSLHAILSGLAGDVRICDPYLDSTTIEHLSACPKASRVLLVSKNVKDTGTLRQLLAAARVEGRTIEIRIPNASVLHDRYLIDANTMVILGTSLNGFGKKQSFIIRAGDDIRTAMIKEFDALWNSSQAWP